MRWLGLLMAAFGGAAAVVALALGGGVVPFVVWAAVSIVGIIIVAKHPKEK